MKIEDRSTYSYERFSWTDHGVNYIGIRTFHFTGHYLQIQENDVTCDVISKMEDSDISLKARKCRIEEKDPHGKLKIFFGYVFTKEIDGIRFDIGLDDSSDCYRLIVKEQADFNSPDDRFFLLHSLKDNSGMLESFKYPGYFLKFNEKEKDLCMDHVARNVFRGSKRRSTKSVFLQYHKFEIFENPMPKFPNPSTETKEKEEKTPVVIDENKSGEGKEEETESKEKEIRKRSKREKRSVHERNRNGEHDGKRTNENKTVVKEEDETSTTGDNSYTNPNTNVVEEPVVDNTLGMRILEFLISLLACCSKRKGAYKIRQR